jgi:hypothetical protein
MGGHTFYLLALVAVGAANLVALALPFGTRAAPCGTVPRVSPNRGAHWRLSWRWRWRWRWRWCRDRALCALLSSSTGAGRTGRTGGPRQTGAAGA